MVLHRMLSSPSSASRPQTGASQNQSPSLQSRLWVRASACASWGMAVTLLLGASCNKDVKEETPKPTSTEIPKPAPAPAAPQFTSFPDSMVQGLNSEQRSAFTRIANEEVCPCGCPKSLAACLQAESNCKAAAPVGAWIAEQLRGGLPEDTLAQALAKDVGGFTGAARPLKLDGYPSKGSDKAEFTVVEFADFQCGHCKMAAEELQQLVKKYPDRVRVVFKHFPLSFHPVAKQAAIATEAAALQGKFWEMHDAVFATQEMLDEKLIAGHAKGLGLDMAKFEKDMKDPAVIAKVESSIEEGKSLGIDGTPALYVNGRLFALQRNVAGFEQRIEMEKLRAVSSCQ